MQHTEDASVDRSLDKAKGCGKSASLPEWLPKAVFDHLLLPYVINQIGVGTDMWDLESGSKLLDITQDGLDMVIAQEDLGVDGFKLNTSSRLYGFVSLKPYILWHHMQLMSHQIQQKVC
jgi:hypothetical protein